MSCRNELIANALKTIARLDHGVAFVVRGVGFEPTEAYATG